MGSRQFGEQFASCKNSRLTYADNRALRGLILWVPFRTFIFLGVGTNPLVGVGVCVGLFGSFFVFRWRAPVRFFLRDEVPRYQSRRGHMEVPFCEGTPFAVLKGKPKASHLFFFFLVLARTPPSWWNWDGRSLGVC